MKYLLGAFFCLFEHGPVETKFRTNSLQLRFDCKNISEFRGSANGCLGLRAQVYVLSHLNDDFVHYSKPTQWRASFKNVLPDFCVCLFVLFCFASYFRSGDTVEGWTDKTLQHRLPKAFGQR